jgi:predicted enzyme related to lactoylglutathione lyase
MEMSSYPPGTPSWVDLGTPDPDAAATFYGGLFGWDVRESAPDTGGYRLCELRGKPVAGLGPQMNPDMPPMWATYIATADADATVQAVRDAGGQVLMGPMDVMTVGRMAVCTDSTGAAFSVWQAGDHIGAGLVDEPNTLCWNELATRQPEVAARFYGDVFGWEAKTTDAGGMNYTEWQNNGRSVAGMMPMGDNFPADTPPHWGVCFAVADVDATVAKVTESGGTVHQPPMDIPVGRFAAVADPQGAAFSLITLARQP